MNCDCCGKNVEGFDLVTALFDVVNYIPTLDWMQHVPLKQYGSLIFDIWDTEKIKKEGFEKTERIAGGINRTVTPVYEGAKGVAFEITLETDEGVFKEIHDMYLYSEKDIRKATESTFDIVEIRPTDSWQTWYKLRKK